ncbi:ABC transporter permease [Sulfurovum sp. NBC37-1]|uniref:ABC transporter permease n=1 Tax=Sulfurovum sp. (strain NBC37-1) TaxID=387093 RepID=UPI00015876EC|nr:ABC transporter permease subunit [Sulfurovum sp. NBC37-1]BAF71916.1 iron (III) ABC transporter, permease [Sulfurovum sp. NBC37-1]
MQRQTFAWGVILLFVLIGLLPIIVMVWNAFSGMDLQTLRSLFSQKEVYGSFVNSLLLSFVVALITTFSGMLLGVLFAKTDLATSRFFLSLLIVPLLIPPYIIALGWIDVIGVNSTFSSVLFGFGGTAWVLFSVYLPIPTVLTMVFLKQVAPDLEDAARLYTGDIGALRYISLPLIIPALVLSFLLVFILTFGEYSVANVLRYSVFPLESFVRFSAFYDFKAALMMALPMIVVAAGVLLVERVYLDKKLFKLKELERINIISLPKKYQIGFSIFVGLVILLIVVLPLLSLFLRITDFEVLLAAFAKAWMPLLHSFLYSFTGAALLTLFGFLSAYIIAYRVVPYWRFYDASIVFLLTLPATVLAIGLILLWNRPMLDVIYASALIVIFGYVGKYLAVAAKMSERKLLQIPPSMMEAAQISGANWFAVLRYILLPQSKKTLIAVFAVSFIFCFRESTITMLVYPPGYETLPVYIVTQMANGKPETIASLSAIIVLSIVVPFSILSRRRTA